MTIDKNGGIDLDPTPAEVDNAPSEIMAALHVIATYVKNNPASRTSAILAGNVEVGDVTHALGGLVGSIENNVIAILENMAKNKDFATAVASAVASFDHVKAWLPGDDGKL